MALAVAVAQVRGDGVVDAAYALKLALYRSYAAQSVNVTCFWRAYICAPHRQGHRVMLGKADACGALFCKVFAFIVLLLPKQHVPLRQVEGLLWSVYAQNTLQRVE